jgi:type IV pilus assembly protein PilB
MHIPDDQLKKFILDAGLVSRVDIAHVERVVTEEGRRLSDAMIAAGFLTEDDMRRIESYVLGIPFVILRGEKIEFQTLLLVPEPIARAHNVVVYRRQKGSLEVAMLSIADLPAVDFLRKKTGYKILPRLTDSESMRYALRLYQKTLKEEFGDLIAKNAATLVARDEYVNLATHDEASVKTIAEDASVTSIVDTLLRHAILQNASDIHIEPYEDELVVRYRINRALVDAMKLPKVIADAIVARLKLLANVPLNYRHLPQDGRFKMEMDRQKISFRVSIIPVYSGEKIVMRLLKENRSGFSLEGIGFHGRTLEQVHRAISASAGIILIVGPMESGKTTTLYTLLDILNTPDVSISTIEDPIEYQIPRINQSQVNNDIGFTFSVGLRSLMKQDPDIVMVGEIRDAESANLAINASLSGHLVLSSFEAPSPMQGLETLLRFGIDNFLLASSVRMLIGQQLVRRLGDDKLSYTLTLSERQELEKYVDLDQVLCTLKEERFVLPDATWNDIVFYHPKENGNTIDGYNGNIALHHIVEFSPSIKDMIISQKGSKEIEAQLKREKISGLIEDGIYKAARGLTSIEEVLKTLRS